MKTKMFEFKVWIRGYGKTKEEAWEDAIEGFMPDPYLDPDTETTVETVDI